MFLEFDRRGLRPQTGDRWSKYIPWEPYPRQQELIDHSGRFVLAHGTTRGSKSIAALMKVLTYVEHPGYSALFLRRTFPELEQAKAPLYWARQWLAGTDARYDGSSHRFHFPSGASVEFGHCANPDDFYKYLGGSWQCIVFDELTSFTEQQFGEIVSRNTRTTDIEVPLQVIGTTNPGGPHEEWVYNRFLNPETKRPDHHDIKFTFQDNPSIDEQEVRKAVGQTLITRQRQLLEGEWMVAAEGQYVSADWFQFTQDIPEFSRLYRAWDISLTKDGNYTVGILLGKGADETYYILDCIRVRLETPTVRQLILDTAANDPHGTIVCVERTVVSLNLIQDLIRNDQFVVTRDFDPTKSDGLLLPDLVATGKKKSVHLVPVKVHGRSGDKLARASGFISRLYQRKVWLKVAPWNTDYVAEWCRFTNEDHNTDDQIDATSLAFEVSFKTRGGEPLREKVYIPGTQEYHDEFDRRMKRMRRRR
ncbi:MAG: phage terminase large subunit [Acidobacteria bacterium]|nr:phage terminase large subunit [Acidobacteriota bacterium]